MSKFNDLANDPKYAKATRAWVRKQCPLVWIYAPSNEGKTTWLGSLFPRDPGNPEKIPLWTYEREDYIKVLYIDADQGAATVDHYTDNPYLCDYKGFDQPANQHLKWTYEQLDAASSAKCNAIVIEGLTSVHKRLLAIETRKVPGATGNALRRCSISPATHLQGVIDAVLQIKQNRIAAGTGVPIIASVNTKIQPIDPEKPDAGDRHVPAWSPNLILEAMRGADAHIQLVRGPAGTRLITMKQPGPHPHCKMRSADVAEAVQAESNLNLPGMLTLWAAAARQKANKVKAAVDKRHAADQTKTPDGQ